MSIFSSIIAGKIPCFKLYESDTAIAFLDINPLSRGHCLVVPKHTAVKVHELPDNIMVGVSKALSVVSKAVMEITGCTAYNIVSNNGKTAGQEVMHVHFHIIPKPNREQGFGFSLTDSQQAKLKNVQRKVLGGGSPSFESDIAYAFLDNDNGHGLVIPKHYSERIDQLPENVMIGVGASLLAATKAISSGCSDYNILLSNGSIAGQTGKFLQFHIISRPNQKEGIKVSWPKQEGDMGKLKVLGNALAAFVGHLDPASMPQVSKTTDANKSQQQSLEFFEGEHFNEFITRMSTKNIQRKQSLVCPFTGKKGPFLGNIPKGKCPFAGKHPLMGEKEAHGKAAKELSQYAQVKKEINEFTRRADEAEHRIVILEETLSILTEGKSVGTPKKNVDSIITICDKLCKEKEIRSASVGWPGVHWIQELQKRLKNSSGALTTIRANLKAEPGIARSLAYIEKELGHQLE